MAGDAPGHDIHLKQDRTVVRVEEIHAFCAVIRKGNPPLIIGNETVQSFQYPIWLPSFIVPSVHWTFSVQRGEVLFVEGIAEGINLAQAPWVPTSFFIVIKESF